MVGLAWKKYFYFFLLGVAVFTALMPTAISAAVKNSRVLIVNSKFDKNPLLTKAVVIGIAEDIFTVKAGEATYTIKATPQTRYQRSLGNKSYLSEISVGDALRIAGRRTGGASLEARVIRNLSISGAHALFSGSVKSVDVKSKTFVLASKTKGDLRVPLANVRLQQNKDVKTMDDLKAGANVVVFGIWNKKKASLTDVRRIIIIPAQVVANK